MGFFTRYVMHHYSSADLHIDQIMENTHDRSANAKKRMISHFPIVQAIFPTKPRSIRTIAMIMKMIPRVRSQLAIQLVLFQPGILKPA
jgi:hypothetical protein